MKNKHILIAVSAALVAAFGGSTAHGYSLPRPTVDSLSRNAVSNTIAQFERDFRAGKNGELLLQAVSSNSVLQQFNLMSDDDKFQYCVNKKVSEATLDINSANPSASIYNQVHTLTELANQELHAYEMTEIVMGKIVQGYNDVRWYSFMSDKDLREDVIKKAHNYLKTEYNAFRNQARGLITPIKKRITAITLHNEYGRRYTLFTNELIDYSNNPS